MCHTQDRERQHQRARLRRKVEILTCQLANQLSLFVTVALTFENFYKVASARGCRRAMLVTAAVMRMMCLVSVCVCVRERESECVRVYAQGAVEEV